MGDAPFITLLSLVPLAVLVLAGVTTGIAWRAGRRSVRRIVGVLLAIIGPACIAATAGLIFSLVGGAAVVAMGIALLIGSREESRPRS